MSDSEEEARNGDVVLLAINLAQTRSRNAIFVAQDLHSVMLKQDLDVRGVEDALLHRLRCTKERLAHDKIDLTTERCEVGSLLAGSIATAHNRYVLLAIEEAVAGCASTHAQTSKLLLRRQSEVLCRSTCADDNRLCLNLLLAIYGEVEWACRGVNLGYDACADICAKTLCLRTHIVHHLSALHAVRVAGEVLNLGCCGKLSSRLNALVQNRIQRRAGSIDGSGKSSRSATDNQNFYSLHI